MTSSYRIQNIVTTASSRKATKRNSCLFPSCVTQKSGLLLRSESGILKSLGYIKIFITFNIYRIEMSI
ncbi:hypothetical protein C0W50_06990 [Photobacterium leiognathi subsp. mandapamensis]|nr:hypothetical protein C0W50_06990 [Photobacterium leiognathi subsp. mandapamensis]